MIFNIGKQQSLDKPFHASSAGITATGAATIPIPATGLAIDGYNGKMMVFVKNTDTGVGATVTFEGSYDAASWVPVGYYKLGAHAGGTTTGQASPTRAIAGDSLPAGAAGNPSFAYYQILDGYKFLRISLAVTGATTSPGAFFAWVNALAVA